MNDPDHFGFFEEPSPEEASPFAIEVPVLKVFDGDGFLTKIALCQLTGNPDHHTGEGSRSSIWLYRCPRA